MKHNLPSVLTPFIGRSEEVTTIKNTLLMPSQRLITLVGEGGIGKTRLALAVAQQVQEQFSDGVWFAPLAGLASAENLSDRLAGAIAEAMHLTFGGQNSLTDQLCRYLRTKQSLLILDSFEHLLEGADFILELLRNTSTLKILITSRHILNFQAEYSWRVERLSVPESDQGETLSPELLLRYESIALFVERARRVMRGFSLTDDNQREVARICQFVGGLPLGAELAAALTRHYTCAEIVAALNQNYTIYHEEGYQLYEAKAWARLGRIAHAAGNDAMAHSYVNQALQIVNSTGLDTVQAEFLTDLGHILLNMQQLTEADAVYRQALTGWQQVGSRQAAWRVQAGLAQIALLQNRFATALAHVEAILTNMESAPINALYDPITVYWLCYQALAANQDHAALAILQRGYALLQQLAGQIDDPRLHRSFFENNLVNRTLLLTAQRLGVTTKSALSQSVTGEPNASYGLAESGQA